jgi:NADPH-dependent 2,4-dienoyl-CoA reductase/sulfur reductase-like enzyme
VRLLVIGGSDAGISAGLPAREHDATAEVTLLVADAYPNFSICGIPYHLSGDVPDWHRLLDQHVYLPLGSTAHKQGRVAGLHATGGRAVFAGSLGTQAVKVFDLIAAGTGLRDATARHAGFDPVTVETLADDHKAYYPGATAIRIRITRDRGTGRLLGAQLLGHHGAEIAKRVDTYATAISYGATVADIADLDLAYTPPLGSPWDAT